MALWPVVLLEGGGDLLHRRGEVGGDGDLDLVGAGARRGAQGREAAQERRSVHDRASSGTDGEDDVGRLDQGAGAHAFGETQSVDASVGDDGGDRCPRAGR